MSKSSSTFWRVIADVAVIICIINGWWAVALLIGVIGAWLFPFYVELIVAGIVYDSLFGMIREQGIWGYAGTIVSIVIATFVSMSKRILRR